ncbi:2-oxo acid dehydrogenase subunit E2 [Streptosporangiaceae bacterium NEAU-GS5]|nr:2-oxo acid dehydrogenase subunit E2 [Streptosporangiaceae bacterium NEAU-GS5]
MIEIRVPKLNNNDASYLLVEWIAKDGEAVREGDPLVVLETSKAAEELAAEADGVLHRLLPEGADCSPGQPIAQLHSPNTSLDAPASATPAALSGFSAEPSTGPVSTSASVAPGVRAETAAGDIVVTAPAQRAMEERGITLDQVRSLGKKLIRATDLDALAPASGSLTPTPGPLTAPAPTTGTPSAAAEASGAAGAAGEWVREADPGDLTGGDVAGGDLVDREPAGGEVVELSRGQRRTAEVVEKSHREIPAAYTVIKVDVTDALLAARGLTREHRVLIGVTELVIEALGGLREQYPMFFASPVGGRAARQATAVHVGVTVDVGRGLFIPVVRDADSRPIGDLARALSEHRKTAMNGAFREDDLSGGTITLTLHTDDAVILAIPVVFPGQTCALALTAPQAEVVPQRDGELLVRKTVSLGLAYDHRFINGRESAEFLRTIKTALEGRRHDGTAGGGN